MAQTSVFVDSSVLFASVLSKRGTARDLIDSARNGHLILWVSELVLFEVRRNLEAKAPHALPVLDAFLTADIFKIGNPPEVIVANIAESFVPKDAPIIAGAIANNCRFLATYDRAHLLSQAARIHELHGIVVATPNDILETLHHPI